MQTHTHTRFGGGVHETALGGREGGGVVGALGRRAVMTGPARQHEYFSCGYVDIF